MWVQKHVGKVVENVSMMDYLRLKQAS